MSKLVPLLLLFNVLQSTFLFNVRKSVGLLFILVQMQAVITQRSAYRMSTNPLENLPC